MVMKILVTTALSNTNIKNYQLMADKMLLLYAHSSSKPMNAGDRDKIIIFNNSKGHFKEIHRSFSLSNN